MEHNQTTNMAQSPAGKSITSWLRRHCGGQALKKFLRNSAGNMTVMFAAAAVPMAGFAGAAVEYTQYSRVRTNMLEALDSAGLAISQKALELGYDTANLSTSQETFLKDFGRDFFDANFTNKNMIKNFALDFTFSSTTVTPVVSGTMKTSLLNVIGFNEFKMNSSTEITLAGSGSLELALVLDVTGSMSYCSAVGYYYCGTSRMDALKSSVDNMLDTLIGTSNSATSDSVKVAIIPFNSQVNIGASNSGVMGWMDTNAEAYYHGYNFVHMTDSNDVDFTTKVNHFNLLNSSNQMSWQGCVEARPYPLDEYDVPSGSTPPSYITSSYNQNPLSSGDMSSSTVSTINQAFSDAPSPLLPNSQLTDAKNTKFVPFFWPDEPESGWADCNTGSYYKIFDCATSNGWTDYYWNGEFIDDSDYVSDSYYSSWSNHTQYRDLVRNFRANIAYDQGDINLGQTLSEGGKSDNYNWVLDPDVISYASQLQWDMGDYLDEEFRLRQAYVGKWDSSSQTYKGKYDTGVDISYYSNGIEAYGPNVDCNAPIQPLTNARADLNDAMNKLTPHGNTNTAVGAIWGWRAVSNVAPFTEGVDPNGPDGNKWSKAVVIMTDGENTFASDDTHNHSFYSPYGYGEQNRLNLNYDGNRPGGSVDSKIWSEHNKEFTNKTLRICARMRAQGIKVYTVGYGIASGGNQETMLKACASSVDDYYSASNAAQLQDAFRQITDNLVNLHISR